MIDCCKCQIKSGNFSSFFCLKQFDLKKVYLLTFCDNFVILNNQLFTMSPLNNVRALGKFSFNYIRYIGEVELKSIDKLITLKCDIVFDVDTEKLSYCDIK